MPPVLLQHFYLSQNEKHQQGVLQAYKRTGIVAVSVWHLDSHGKCKAECLSAYLARKLSLAELLTQDFVYVETM